MRCIPCCLRSAKCMKWDRIEECCAFCCLWRISLHVCTSTRRWMGVCVQYAITIHWLRVGEEGGVSMCMATDRQPFCADSPPSRRRCGKQQHPNWGQTPCMLSTKEHLLRMCVAKTQRTASSPRSTYVHWTLDQGQPKWLQHIHQHLYRQQLVSCKSHIKVTYQCLLADQSI